MNAKVVEKTPEKEEFSTVIVKKGDFLERIARSNHTTVSALMQLNDLSSTQLQIGQVLRVPKTNKTEKDLQVKTPNLEDYYVVKEGDSPWAIALSNGIRLDELLKLNGLDEQKARRLRPGDRLRIR
ncbi:muramidase [Chlamydia trachomatis]|nr:muramidase [Chlamydia trachomatis]CRH47521.1 muramidase [Chlamydia trachomatis]